MQPIFSKTKKLRINSPQHLLLYDHRFEFRSYFLLKSYQPEGHLNEKQLQNDFLFFPFA